MLNKKEQKKPQTLKGRTKMKFYQNISNYYDQMNYTRQTKTFQFEEEPFCKGAQSVAFIMHKVLLIMKFLQTKSQVKGKNTNYYDLYFTVVQSLSDEERKSWDHRKIVSSFYTISLETQNGKWQQMRYL